MREKYLKICSFAKSRNMQFILFILFAMFAIFCLVIAIMPIGFFTFIKMFSEADRLFSIFSMIFLLNNYDLILYKYLDYFAILVMIVIYEILLIKLLINTFLQLKNNKIIFTELLILFFMILVFFFLFATMKLYGIPYRGAF